MCVHKPTLSSALVVFVLKNVFFSQFRKYARIIPKHMSGSSSLFFVKPAQSVVLLCAPQMMKLGEKVWSAGH